MGTGMSLDIARLSLCQVECALASLSDGEKTGWEHPAVGLMGRKAATQANNPQQSWGFEGEPPEAVIKDSGTRDGTS